jgi:hypothetical protein
VVCNLPLPLPLFCFGQLAHKDRLAHIAARTLRRCVENALGQIYCFLSAFMKLWFFYVLLFQFLQKESKLKV